MSEYASRTFPLGWMPDADAVNAPEGALLRMDNLVLDELGVLAVRQGSTKINAGAPLTETDVHSLFTVVRSGTRIRYGAAGDKIYRNATTPLGVTMAGSGDVAFGSHLGQTLIARSSSKYKDDGTTVRNWGIAMTGEAPDVVEPIEADTKEYASWDSTETAEHQILEGCDTVLAYDEDRNAVPDGAVQFFTDTDTGRGCVTRVFAVPQDVTFLDGGREATDDDQIIVYMYISNPSIVKKTTLQIDVNDGTFNNDFYLKEWAGEGLAGPDGSVSNPGEVGVIDIAPGEAPLL